MNPRTPLVTSRLRLEPVAARHAEGLFQAARASRAELLPWMPWAIDITLESNQHYATDAERSWEAGEEFHFAVLEDGLVLGVVGLNCDADGSAELHYWIRSDRAGHGFTTEAGERILRWGVEQLGVKFFTLWAGVENHASRRVAKKLGFHDAGPLPEPMRGGLGSFPAVGYKRSAGTTIRRTRRPRFDARLAVGRLGGTTVAVSDGIEIWDLWLPGPGATGLSFARSRISGKDAGDRLLVHAAPPKLSVTVRDATGKVLASGEGLERHQPGPMSFLNRSGSTIALEDGWPTEKDIGRVVLLPGGEAGILKAWWNADDRKEWRWQLEFYNQIRG